MGKSSAVAYEITGNREVAAMFKSLGLKSSDLSDVLSVIAAEVASDARGLAPRRTGRLAGDIRTSRSKTKALVLAGDAKVPYAGPVHYGWPRRHIAANLFLTKAADSKAESSAEQLAAEMQRKINSVGLG